MTGLKEYRMAVVFALVSFFLSLASFMLWAVKRDVIFFVLGLIFFGGFVAFLILARLAYKKSGVVPNKDVHLRNARRICLLYGVLSMVSAMIFIVGSLFSDDKAWGEACFLLILSLGFFQAYIHINDAMKQ